MQDNISWKAYEYKHTVKTNDWFWILGIIGISFAVASMIFGNIIFAIFILLATFSIALFAIRKPALINIEINNKGILVDKNFFPFQNLESFCIEDGQDSKLFLKSKRLLMPLIVLGLDDNSGENVHVFLSKHLKEELLEESFWQKLMDKFGV